MNYHSESGASVLASLTTNEHGLSAAEAERRLSFYGKNELPAKKTTPWHLIWNQINSPVVWLLLGALLIAYSFGQGIDASIILAVIVINGVLGFIQEYKAERAIDALKKTLQLHTTVIRDGKRMDIKAADLVPGDIISVETGTHIAADCRILKAVLLSTQEASLTGESTPVPKSTAILPPLTGVADRANMLYCGTTVASGNGLAVVTATGTKTEIGKIARMLETTEENVTPLQKKINALGSSITFIVLFIAALMMTIGLIEGLAPMPLLLIAVAIAVAAIPESMPAVVTLTLAAGVQRMAKRNALVRKLSGVQTLGACTIIFTDKTGTLTRNEMTVRELYVPHKRIILDENTIISGQCAALLGAGALCNNATLGDTDGTTSTLGDPTETALLGAARLAGISNNRTTGTRVGEIPFTSDRRRMTVIHRDTNGKTAYTKGALDDVLPLCTHKQRDGRIVALTPADRASIIEAAKRMAATSLRVLAFASKKLTASEKTDATIERKLVFLGLQGMHDPPRQEAAEAVRTARKAGIRVVMITGDHPSTAAAIAKEIGIPGRVMTGEELDRAHDLYAATADVGVFARVDPAHKLRIVEAYKAHGSVVAMTGDGVNDAPALKAADIGVAMGRIGTDVAREASDMVLADDNFATIVEAVRGGRTILDNIIKFITYILSGNIAEVLTLLIGTLVTGNFPMTLIMILWMNLVTDGLPALALATERPEELIMRRKPGKVDAPLLTHKRLLRMTLVGLGVCAIALGLFFYRLPDGTLYAQTLTFTALVIIEMAIALSCRSERVTLAKLGVFTNGWLLLNVALTIALQVAIVSVPALQALFGTTSLTPADWGLVFGGAALTFILMQLGIRFAPIREP